MTTPFTSRFSTIAVGRLVRDYIVLSGGQMLSKVLGFLAFAYLARILTVTEFGAIETAVGMSAIGYKVIELGTGSIGARRIAQGAQNVHTTLGAVISARMAIATIVIPLLAVIYASFTAAQLPTELVWLFALSLFAAPFAHEWLFQAHERMAYAAFSPLLKMLVFFGAIFVFAPQKNGPAMVGLAELVAMATVAVYFTLASKRSLKIGTPAYGLNSAIGLLKDSTPLGLSAFANSVGVYAPVLVVTVVAGAEAAGLFGAAHRVVFSLVTFSFIYYFNLLPLFSRLLHANPQQLQLILNASMRVTAWAGATVCLSLWTLGDLIVTVIFGARFESAGAVFKILIWVGAFEVVSGNARLLIVAAHRQSYVLAAQVAGAAAAILLAYILAPHYGAQGAAVAVVIANGVIWLLASALTKNLPVRLPLIPVLRHVGGALIASALIVYLSPAPFVSTAIAGLFMLMWAALDRAFMPALKILANAKDETSSTSQTE